MQFPQVWLRARGYCVSEKPDPSSEESAREGLLGQYGATIRTCSLSSLILHSVCASRLTGGMHICAGPGASCVPVYPCQELPRIGSRTTGNGRFLEQQKGLPEQLQTDSKSAGLPGMESPKKCSSRQLVGCLIEYFWDVDSTKQPQKLLTPEEEVTGELHMQLERKPHCHLIYAKRSPCFPYGPERPCLEGAI